MTKLYLANATRQHQDIHLRLPERASPIVHRIAPGHQIRVGVDLNSAELDVVLKQGHKYGWAEASSTNRPAQTFSGIVYSLDKPIPANRTIAAMENNLSVLQKRGKQTRDLAAVATSDALERQLAETNVAELVETDVEILEEDRAGRGSEDRIAEGRVISRNAPPKSEKTGNRRERKQKT